MQFSTADLRGFNALPLKKRREKQRILSPKGFSLNAPQNQVEICTKTVYSVGSAALFPTVFPTRFTRLEVDA
jgi:hypothetical protein